MSLPFCWCVVAPCPSGGGGGLLHLPPSLSSWWWSWWLFLAPLGCGDLCPLGGSRDLLLTDSGRPSAALRVVASASKRLRMWTVLLRLSLHPRWWWWLAMSTAVVGGVTLAPHWKWCLPLFLLPLFSPRRLCWWWLVLPLLWWRLSQYWWTATNQGCCSLTAAALPSASKRLQTCNGALCGKTAKLSTKVRIAVNTPVRRIQQGWSVVRRWKRNAVKPGTLRVWHELCLRRGLF